MNNQITPETALNNLYMAARNAPLKADDHDLLQKSAQVPLEIIKPKEDKKVDTKKA